MVDSMSPPRDVLSRFSNRAQDYSRSRPSYAPETIDAVLAGLAAPGSLVAADIGAGTGISSRLLAQRGVRVFAIEPNEPMRTQGAGDSNPLIEWREATGEATGLPDHSLDLVLCAQAFHWLDAGRALEEFRRILKPGARSAVVWNVLDEADEFSHGYSTIVAAHATDPPQSPWFTGVSSPFPDAPGWTNARTIRAANAQALDRDGLLRRALSASYSPTSGPAHEALKRELLELFDSHSRDGVVILRYQTDAHLSETSHRSMG
jgi:SAM-dependent methyltransferase